MNEEQQTRQRKLNAKLRQAAARDDVSALREALEQGAQLEGRSSCGSTALSVAAQFGSLACLGELLEAGAEFSPSARHGGQSSAMAAAIEGFELDALWAMARFALSGPAQLSTQEQWNALDMEIRHSLLDACALHGCPEAVEALASLVRSQAPYPFHAGAITAFVRRGRLEMAAWLWGRLERAHARADVWELLERAASGAQREMAQHFQAFMARVEGEQLDLVAARAGSQEDRRL